MKFNINNTNNYFPVEVHNHFEISPAAVWAITFLGFLYLCWVNRKNKHEEK